MTDMYGVAIGLPSGLGGVMTSGRLRHDLNGSCPIWEMERSYA